ncbi:MAG TPA: STAS domain-containing protein [Stellaceae bacterium]|nr:STAS domain-containing protein [Stellaceae bacterium]
MEQFNDNHMISMGNNLTISAAEIILPPLHQALTLHSRIELDCDEESEVDVWFIQLIISMSKSARKKSIEIAMSNRLSNNLRDMADRAGFAALFEGMVS